MACQCDKPKREDKAEFGIMIDIYIVYTMVISGRKIECENCGTKEKLTIQHTKYFDHTIDDLKLLCWPCHSFEDFGIETQQRKFDGIREKNGYIYMRGVRFELTSSYS